MLNASRRGTVQSRAHRGPLPRAPELEKSRHIGTWATANATSALPPIRDDAWLQHIAPVHWNHINLTGDYSWRQNKRVEKGGLRAAQVAEGLAYFILRFVKSPLRNPADGDR